MRRYALGIDGGGSKCDAALLEESGAVVGWGRGGPTHVYYDSPEVIAASYADAITAALQGVTGAEIWVAGNLPSGAPREAVERAGALACHMTVNEVDSAFACVQAEWGLIVLSGTGSFVHARSREGRDLHFGGLGPILNDYGSAYEIGLRGLRAAFASDWTAKRRTSLAEAIVRELGVSRLRDVFDLVYVKGFGRRQIAALAQVVNVEAEAGDHVAADCIRCAADELAELAADAIRELDMMSLSFPAIAIGGVAQRCRLWWERMCVRLEEAAPGVRPVIPPVAPAVGAGLIGLREMGIAWTAEVVGRATASYRELETGGRRAQPS